VGLSAHLIAYGPERFEERTVSSASELRPRGFGVVWVNVDSTADVESVAAVGEAFGLHELALEDVMTSHQRPKIEEYGEHLYIVGRAATLGARIQTEQISVFLGPGFVLTFQEGRPGDCFEPVRQALRQGRGELRRSGADRLAYALLDRIVESYFPVLERVGERVEALETRIVARPVASQIQRVHEIKRDLLDLRRALWPLREALNHLLREDFPLISKETRVYLRDTQDHSLRLLDMTETYRELASDLGGLYLDRKSVV
jgi:magnesium transporter